MTKGKLLSLKERDGYDGEGLGHEYSLESIDLALSEKSRIFVKKKEKELEQLARQANDLSSLIHTLKTTGKEFLQEETLQVICKDLLPTVEYFTRIFGSVEESPGFTSDDISGFTSDDIPF